MTTAQHLEPKVHERAIRILDADPPTRQELDLDFLGSGYRRRVFVISTENLGCPRAPFQTRASLLLVPIPVHGETLGRLLYRSGTESVRMTPLRSGRYYFIPPGLPCQVELTAIGVLEAFSPVTKSGIWFEEEALPWEVLGQFNRDHEPSKGVEET